MKRIFLNIFGKNEPFGVTDILLVPLELSTKRLFKSIFKNKDENHGRKTTNLKVSWFYAHKYKSNTRAEIHVYYQEQFTSRSA